jgi:hypothetical protein
MLALAATPSAASAGLLVPWGETWCNAQQRCVTPTEGIQPDGTRWAFEWGSFDPYRWVPSQPIRDSSGALIGSEHRPRFKLYHPNRADEPYLLVTQAWQVPIGVAFAENHSLGNFQYNSAQCGQLTDFVGTEKPPRIIQAGPNVATNPPLMHQCFPNVFDELGQCNLAACMPAPAAPTESTQPVAAAPTAAKLQSCAAVTVTKRVAVTSLGLSCTNARNILARFLRSKQQAPGWVCRKMLQAASCGNGAKKITGRWR